MARLARSFYIGKRPTDSGSATFPAWTQAPNTLSRTGRILERTAATLATPRYGLNRHWKKIFREDRMQASGSVNPVHRIYLARNERESFQLVLRPQKGKPLTNVQVRLNELINARSGRAHFRRKHPHLSCAIPQRRHSFTFRRPDRRMARCIAPHTRLSPLTASQCSPIWFTLHANVRFNGRSVPGIAGTLGR